MKEFSKFFALKNIKLILGLYLVISLFLIVDAYLLHLTVLVSLGRLLWFLPFVLLMLLFCLIAVKRFENEVLKQQEKHNSILEYKNVRTVCSSKKIFATDEWLVIAGKTAFHFREIAEMGDVLTYPALKTGGVCKMAMTLQNGKKITIQGDDLGKLSVLKTAWIEIRDNG